MHSRHVTSFFSVLVCAIALVLGLANRAEATESLSAPQLQEPASILWDGEGIPHIQTASERDAFVLLGYVHAQDRFFQIDFFRHLFEGRLTEMVGAPGLGSDRQYRRWDLRRAAVESLAMLPPESRDLMAAYAEGVNLFLARHPLPIEYGFLELGPESVRPWLAEDSLLLLKGFTLGSWLDLSDIERTAALEAYRNAGEASDFDGDALFYNEIFRLAPIVGAVTVPEGGGGALAASSVRESGRSNAIRSAPFRPSPQTVEQGRELARELRQHPLLAASLDGDHGGIGSNWWLVAGEHTASGKAILANDPHQFLSLPPVLYEVQLQARHSLGRGAEPLDITGATFAGMPAVVTGCTRRVCFGATNSSLDLTDVYEEEVIFDRATGLPTHTVFRGEREPLRVTDQSYRANVLGDGALNTFEELAVGPLEGGKTFHVPRRNQGPLMSFGTPVDGRATGLSVQFTGWTGTLDLEAFLRWHRAQTLRDFQDGLRFADGFTFNMAYADVRGNLGYFVTGEMPLREDLQLLGAADGAEPYLIRDGRGERLHEWLPAVRPRADRSLNYQVLPLVEMPSAINPEQGFLVSANNDPLGSTLDNDALNQQRPGGGVHYLHRSYVSLRAQRIRTMLEETLSAGKVDQAAVRRMQSDHRLPDAALLVPELVEAYERATHPGNPMGLASILDEPRLAEAVQRLEAWDGSAPTGIQQGYDPGDDPDALAPPSQQEIDDSVAATLFSVYRGQLLQRVVDGTLQRLNLADHLPPYRQGHVALLHLLQREDDARVPQDIISGVEFFRMESFSEESARDAVLLQAMRDTLDLLAGDAFADAFGGSTELSDYRWGKLHRITLGHPLGGPLSVPPMGGFENLAPELPGLARGGGFATVDTGTHDLRASDANAFRYTLSPGRRFYAVLDPAGIEAFQILPGGQSGDPTSPGYTSQLGRWLTNRYAPVQTLDPLRTKAAVEDDGAAAPGLRVQHFLPAP
ncbi:MAG: penicillin acylase family protein [Acidobacteriota bacterium]|nr:penicillin acylase family protein [Acidobacteriota bacterium]